MMRNLLLPIDGTEKSQRAIEWVKMRYRPDEVKIALIIVREDLEDMRSQMEYDQAKAEMQPLLDRNAALLQEYPVSTRVCFGRAGEEILHFAADHAIDTIIMTRSTRSGWNRMIGSVTSYVVKYAECVVVVVPEAGTH